MGHCSLFSASSVDPINKSTVPGLAVNRQNAPGKWFLPQFYFVQSVWPSVFEGLAYKDGSIAQFSTDFKSGRVPLYPSVEKIPTDARFQGSIFAVPIHQATNANCKHFRQFITEPPVKSSLLYQPWKFKK